MMVRGGYVDMSFPFFLLVNGTGVEIKNYMQLHTTIRKLYTEELKAKLPHS